MAVLQRPSWIAEIETLWPTKRKTFTAWPLTEGVLQHQWSPKWHRRQEVWPDLQNGHFPSPSSVSMCDCLVAVRFQQPWLQENLWSTKMPRSLLQSLLLRPVAEQAPPTLEFFRTCIYLGSFPFVAFVPTSCFTKIILNHKSLIHLWANLPSFVFSMYLFSFLSVCSSKLLILKES